MCVCKRKAVCVWGVGSVYVGSSVESKIVKTSKKDVCSQNILEQTSFLDVFTILLSTLVGSWQCVCSVGVAGCGCLRATVCVCVCEGGNVCV